MPERPIILDVGGGSGEWSRPYRLAGYDVRVIDPTVWPSYPAQRIVDEWEHMLTHHHERREPPAIRGVLLAPPCTQFAGSGARWWDGKAAEEPQLLEHAVTTVRQFLRIVELVKPDWWALENPSGRLAKCVPELGKWRYTWQPWQYGTPETKRTCMWGEHTRPAPTITERPAIVTARVHRMAPSPDRARLRSITPAGFAQAFFEANP